MIGNLYLQNHFCIGRMTILVLYQAVPILQQNCTHYDGWM